MHTPSLAAPAPDTPLGYVSNGFLGFTVPRSPLATGELRVSGCFGRSATNDTEWIACLPNPFGLELRVDHRPLSAHADSFRSQRYDFARAELCTENQYQADGLRLDLRDQFVCLRSRPAVAARRVVLRSNVDCALTLRAFIDSSTVYGTVAYASSPVREADSLLLWDTGAGRCGIALATVVAGAASVTREPFERLSTVFRIGLTAGRELVVTQIGAAVPSVLHSEPHWQALRVLRAASWRGWDAIVAEHREAWAELWRSRVLLCGAGERWQQLSDAAFYYLLSSAHAAAPGSVPPFGLSSSSYGGHVFWDTEIFMYPVLLLAAPPVAQATLRYRTDRLAAAGENARVNGYGGAMFPWESASSGAEVTPIYAATSEEHHITLDVAFACLQYAYATDDRLFVDRQIRPLLIAVCRWIASRVEKTSRGYEIRHVVGVDEGEENVHNNSYTNIAAAIVLRGSARVLRSVGVDPPAVWETIADGIVIPVDERLGIIRKHDSYTYSGGPCVPETLAAFFPLTYRHPDDEVERRTYRYHLDLAETVLHYPMLSSMFGVWAARQGDRAFALHCFERGIAEFSCSPFDSFSEFSGTDRPNFLTNPAGFLTACLYGLTGLQLDDGDPTSWGTYPIVLPEGWDAIEVERLWIRGRPARLSAPHGAERVSIDWLD